MDAARIQRVAVLGAGVIGASWTALFLAAGREVEVFDPADDCERTVRDAVEKAWPTLESLGMTTGGSPDNLRFHRHAGRAVRDVQFVQESIPERLALKHALFREIEPALAPQAVVASSASGLMVSEMQRGWKDPARFLLGHPFNPPHLIPLVELLANEHTGEGVLEYTEAFYRSVGKVTIRVRREVPAHVANRLQAALWKEAISLVENGVVSVEDADRAVWAGPGLRWAVMGPHMLFHLGAGPGGLREFCHRYRDSFHRWWDDLGDVELTGELADRLASGVDQEGAGRDVASLCGQRDGMIAEILRATAADR